MRNKKISLLAITLPVIFLALVLLAGCSQPPPPPPPATSTTTSTPAQPAADTKTAPSAAPTEEVAPPLTGQFKRKSNRDPFIPVVGKPVETPATPVAGNPEDPTKKGTGKKTGSTETIYTGEQLGVGISGIMKNGSHYEAIISASGKNILVKPGQKLDDRWSVATITPNMVVLKARGAKAIIKLQNQGSPGGKGATAPDNSGPVIGGPRR